jgi:hypothetical protein
MATSSTSFLIPTATTNPTLNDDPAPVRHASPVVAFIIGLSIMFMASILNAAGLNLTKLDHVRACHGMCVLRLAEVHFRSVQMLHRKPLEERTGYDHCGY